MHAPQGVCQQRGSKPREEASFTAAPRGGRPNEAEARREDDNHRDEADTDGDALQHAHDPERAEVKVRELANRRSALLQQSQSKHV